MRLRFWTLALGDAGEHLVQGERALLGELLGPHSVGPLVGQGARRLLILDHAAELAGIGQLVEADDLDRCGRARLR